MHPFDVMSRGIRETGSCAVLCYFHYFFQVNTYECVEYIYIQLVNLTVIRWTQRSAQFFCRYILIVTFFMIVNLIEKYVFITRVYASRLTN